MAFKDKIKELGKSVIDGLSKDKLTPLERIRKLGRFEEADRVTGSFSFWTPSAVGIHNISAKDYYTNPEIMYYCQLVALNIFNHDFPFLSSDSYNTEPEALGAKLKFPDDDTPLIVEPPIKQKADLIRCRMPDPQKDGRFPYRLEICRIHKEVLGKYFPSVTTINAPFSMAVGMRGYETLMIDMVEDPDFVHNLLEFCTEVVITFGRALKNACGVFPLLADTWSGIPNLSPELFLEFSFPYATRCLQVFEHTAWNFGEGHQLSGDWKQSLRRILTSGTRTFILFEENITGIRDGIRIVLHEFKAICKKHKVFLYTSIHPETLSKGPADKIEILMKNWVKEVSSGGGQGFYTSVLPGTPLKHIDAFVKTIRRAAFPIV
jgi:uroporphyrinogen decarboxylase